MKQILLSITGVAAALILSAAGCKHDDLNVTPANNNPGTTVGTWHVSHYQERTEDKTNDFNGYVFDFAASGTMTATANGQATSGTWQEHSSNGQQRFTISLATNSKPLSRLNHDWLIQTKNDTQLFLDDDNAASDEHVQFTR